MPNRVCSVLLALSIVAASQAQWKDVKQIGKGGESTIASDDAGNVYVSAHLPSTLFASRDWGGSFASVKQFPESLGDMFVLARPQGKVNVVYVRSRIDGIGTWSSDDSAKTFTQGQNILGPLDREWLVADPHSDRLFMDYSNGYIGGPKSKGVFLATSDDNGKTFVEGVRVDREEPGSFPVDPYLSRSADGKLYAMWQTSKDYDTIVAYRVATSSDGGKTFSEPVTITEFSNELEGEKVDIQERWMLGDILGVGDGKAVVVYPSYEKLVLDGKPRIAFVVRYKVSEDGGKSFGPAHRVTPDRELRAAMRSFYSKGGATAGIPRYVQTLPWLCADNRGRVYMAYMDNREGGASVKGKPAGTWAVRVASMSANRGFGESERVSEPFIAKRPPMDFLSCCADSKNLYVSWTENPGSTSDWGQASFDLFTGNLFLARKPIE